MNVKDVISLKAPLVLLKFVTLNGWIDCQWMCPLKLHQGLQLTDQVM